ncbi:hypothetical protein [Leptospira noguchii]|uniref:hypothetical protein n=1 Tax=Leptospira noguchii TaxID=28182 RepID=UPI000774D0D0|nr:hypothetical protein [Leptospira noguchii]
MKAKRCTAFLGMIGLTFALICFTVMLSGNSCPVFNQTIETNCHPSPKTDDQASPTCSSCNLFFSAEHSKTPELYRNYFSVLTVFQNPFHFASLIFHFSKTGKNSNLNAQKFVSQSISSIRLLI